MGSRAGRCPLRRATRRPRCPGGNPGDRDQLGEPAAAGRRRAVRTHRCADRRRHRAAGDEHSRSSCPDRAFLLACGDPVRQEAEHHQLARPEPVEDIREQQNGPRDAFLICHGADGVSRGRCRTVCARCCMKYSAPPSRALACQRRASISPRHGSRPPPAGRSPPRLGAGAGGGAAAGRPGDPRRRGRAAAGRAHRGQGQARALLHQQPRPRARRAGQRPGRDRAGALAALDKFTDRRPVRLLGVRARFASADRPGSKTAGPAGWSSPARRAAAGNRCCPAAVACGNPSLARVRTGKAGETRGRFCRRESGSDL
jgi:hypothetical protein